MSFNRPLSGKQWVCGGLRGSRNHRSPPRGWLIQTCGCQRAQLSESPKPWEGRYKSTRKSGIQTPMAQGRSTTIVSMIQWTRTSRLSIRIFLSRARAGAYSVRQRPRESHRTVQALREGRNQRVGSLDASKHGHPVDPFFPCKGGVSAYLRRNQNVQDLQQPKAD